MFAVQHSLLCHFISVDMFLVAMLVSVGRVMRFQAMRSVALMAIIKLQTHLAVGRSCALRGFFVRKTKS